jgi:thioredoxin 1
MKTLFIFSASWCKPCKALKIILRDIEPQYKDIVEFKYVDIEENPDEADEYNVRSIPTLLLFKDKVLANKHVGGMSRQDLITFIEG